MYIYKPDQVAAGGVYAADRLAGKYVYMYKLCIIYIHI